MVEMCDTNFDGTIDCCELQACLILTENEWRDDNCSEDFGYLYCPNCPCIPPTCMGAMNCLDILEETIYVMDNLDVN
jgi:hypothetical protein